MLEMTYSKDETIFEQGDAMPEIRAFSKLKVQSKGKRRCKD